RDALAPIDPKANLPAPYRESLHNGRMDMLPGDSAAWAHIQLVHHPPVGRLLRAHTYNHPFSCDGVFEAIACFRHELPPVLLVSARRPFLRGDYPQIAQSMCLFAPTIGGHCASSVRSPRGPLSISVGRLLEQRLQCRLLKRLSGLRVVEHLLE